MSVPKPTLIYRITHHQNLPWILEHGVHSRTSPGQDPNFVNIGNKDLIDHRALRAVPCAPHGCLNDYVPFYFWPHSVMLFQIYKGSVEGVTAKQSEIIYLVSSIERLTERNIPFIFTDGHAYPSNTSYFTDPVDLAKLDWNTIRSKDFKKRLDDPDRSRKYQAECLVHRRLPVEALLGIACKDQTGLNYVQREIEARNLQLQATTRSMWYF
jgi:hypothetical protein